MKTKRNLIIFIIVTLSCGWLGVLLDSILTEQPEGNSLGMGLWLILPLLTSLVLRITAHDWKDIGLKLNLKGNGLWYLTSVFLFPLVMLMLTFAASLFGMVEIKALSVSACLSAVLAAIPGNIVKNIFEEFSWRGYLSPKLEALRINDWMLYLVTGLVWSLWHAAYYLVFLPDSFFTAISRPAMLLSGCVIMTGWSIMFVEIQRLTNSVWPCVILHTMEDAVPTALVTLGELITFSRNGALWFEPVSGILPNLVFIAAGLWLRHIRIAKNISYTT